MNRKQIILIAKQVRSLILNTYGTVDGYCHEASQELVKRLENKGILANIVAGFFGNETTCDLSHYWVEILTDDEPYIPPEDRTIVDVTADQFQPFVKGKRIPAVLVTTYRQWQEYNYGAS